jgi:signal peptidase II
MDRLQIARRYAVALLIVVGVLLVDQLIKIWLKTSMTLHEQIEVLSWFKNVFI